MTERRPHWDDDLLAAVLRYLHDPAPLTDDDRAWNIVEAVEDWQDARGDAIDGRSLTEEIFAVQRVRALPARQIVGSDGHVRDMLLRADVLRALDGGPR